MLESSNTTDVWNVLQMLCFLFPHWPEQKWMLMCITFRRLLVRRDLTAAWRVGCWWQSPEIIHRPHQDEPGSSGWRSKNQHAARQHDTCGGERYTTVFLMTVMLWGIYYGFGLQPDVFVLVWVKHCPLLERNIYTSTKTWKIIKRPMT